MAVCLWGDRFLKNHSCTSGSHICAFFLYFQRYDCGHLLNIWECEFLVFPPVFRSSASSGYCSCGFWLSSHHFWDLQFPHLQVSLIASSWRFLSVVLLAQTAEMWTKRKKKRLRERARGRLVFEAGFMDCAALGGSLVFTHCCYSNCSAGDGIKAVVKCV